MADDDRFVSSTQGGHQEEQENVDVGDVPSSTQGGHEESNEGLTTDTRDRDDDDDRFVAPTQEGLEESRETTTGKGKTTTQGGEDSTPGGTVRQEDTSTGPGGLSEKRDRVDPRRLFEDRADEYNFVLRQEAALRRQGVEDPDLRPDDLRYYRTDEGRVRAEVRPGARVETGEGDFVGQPGGWLAPARLNDFPDSGQREHPRKRAGEALERRFERRLAEQPGGPRDTDVEPGRDFTIQRSESGGWVGIPTAELASRLADSSIGETARRRRRTPTGELIQGPSGERAPSTPLERLDMQVDAQAGMDLRPGEDYTVDRTVTEGGRVRYDARVTEEGRRKLRGDEFESGAGIPVPWFVNPDGEPTGVPGFVESDVGEAEARAAQQTIRGAAEAGAEAVAPLSPWVFAERTRAAAERAADRPTDERPDLIEFGGMVLAEPDQEGPSERQVESLVGGGAAAVLGAPIGIGLAAEETREFGAETVERYREEGASVGVRPSDERGTPADPRFIEYGGAAEFAVEEAGETAGQVAGRVGQQLGSPTGRAGLAGSLIFTAGVMGAAGAVSKTAGAATRFAIQPGEELATAGLTRAAPGVARRFPGGRIDWEEPLVYGGIEAARRTRRVAGRAGARARRAAAAARSGGVRAEPRAGAGLVPPRIKITAADLSSERATADLDEPRRIFDPPEDAPRDPTKAGIDEQGAFVGSYTHASDPAFGGSGKPDAGVERDFPTTRWDEEVPPYLQHRTDLVRKARARKLQRIASERTVATEAATSGEEADDPFAAYAVGEETGRVEAAQASSFDDDADYDAGTAATLRERLGEVSAGIGGAVAGVAAAEQSRAEAATEPSTATTLREELASRSDTRSAVDTRTQTETAQEAAQRPETETAQDARSGLEPAGVEMEAMDTELTLEMEVPTEAVPPFEPRLEIPPIEVESSSEDTPFTPLRLNLGGRPQRQTPTERPGLLEPGWLGQQFADIATGGSLAFAGFEPTQADLRRAPRRQRLVGGLPSALEVYGTPAQQAAVADVRAFFAARPGAGFGGFDADFDLDFDLEWSG